MLQDADGRQDPSGGILYNRYDRVKMETLWKQRLNFEKHVKRQNDEHNIKTYGDCKNFQMNMGNAQYYPGVANIKGSHSRLEVVTEKEIAQSPQARSSMKGVDPTSVESMAVQHLKKGPTQKWDVNVTASQEIGWLLANPVRSHQLEPANGKPSRRHIERLKRQGSVPSEVLWSARSSSLPTSERIKNSRSMPHIEAEHCSQHPEVGMLNNSKWRKPKTQYEETKYAAAYYHIMKHDPFNKTAAGR